MSGGRPPVGANTRPPFRSAGGEVGVKKKGLAKQDRSGSRWRLRTLRRPRGFCRLCGRPL